jgi:protein-disulfide isomerase
VLGEPDAPITMVQFVDYECPYCRRFFHSTYGELKREYIDPGKLRLVVKDLPLAFHPLALQAATAAHCAGEQGKYWPMYDKLYGGSAGLNLGALLAYGEQLELDGTAFKSCLESDRHQAQIDADIAEGRAAGIPGTPAFVLGRSGGDTLEGVHIRGALPLPVFKGHIDHLLKESEAQ